MMLVAEPDSLVRSTLFALLASAFFFFAPFLAAQSEGPLNMEPHLSLAFPFTPKQGGIGVKYPVLISNNAVITPEAVLRVIYVPPRGDDVEVLIETKKSNSESSWTKNNQLQSTKVKMTPLQAAAHKIAEETAWPSLTMFQLAFANLNSSDLHIVYLNPETMKLTDEPINFPEGLVLAEVEGKVTVLAVEKEGAGAAAGLKADDQILSVGGSPMNGNLLTFLNALHAAKKAAEDSPARAVALNVRNPKDNTERIAQLKLPISLNSSFLDSPLSDPTSLDKPALPKTKPYGSK
jgi:hypothetical protein